MLADICRRVVPDLFYIGSQVALADREAALYAFYITLNVLFYVRSFSFSYLERVPCLVNVRIEIDRSHFALLEDDLPGE